MADSWEDRKKKKSPIGLVVLGCVVIIIIGFVIWNNLDTFTGKKDVRETETPVEVAGQQKEAPPVDTTEQSDDQNKKGEGVQKEEVASSDASEKGERESEDTEPGLLSIELPTVLCVLADKKGLSIRISLKLYFKEKDLEKEVLFKRDNINFIVKKVFIKKHLSDIVVNVLRAELQKEINALLEQGTVIDIEFLDFKPNEE